MNRLKIYEIPQGAVISCDFKIRIRRMGDTWQNAEAYQIGLGSEYNDRASMVYFDFIGRVECEVTCLGDTVESAGIRPASKGTKYRKEGNTIFFYLTEPVKFIIEVKGKRLHTLYFMVGEIKRQLTCLKSGEKILLRGGRHMDLEREQEFWKGNLKEHGESFWVEGISVHNPGRLLERLCRAGEGAELCFGPGMHYIEDLILEIPSYVKIQIDGGAYVKGAFYLKGKQDVSVMGQGIVCPDNSGKQIQPQGIMIENSAHVLVEGINIFSAALNAVYMKDAYDVLIKDVKIFPYMGRSSEVRIKTCECVMLRDVFIENASRCINVDGGDSMRLCILENNWINGEEKKNEYESFDNKDK